MMASAPGRIAKLREAEKMEGTRGEVERQREEAAFVEEPSLKW